MIIDTDLHRSLLSYNYQGLNNSRTVDKLKKLLHQERTDVSEKNTLKFSQTEDVHK